jgi:hypothetical protein
VESVDVDERHREQDHPGGQVRRRERSAAHQSRSIAHVTASAVDAQ